MDTAQCMALVRRVELFHGLTVDDVGKIFVRGMSIRVARGEFIFTKGSVGSQMYVVLGGQIDVLDGTTRIATLATGDMFGEMALVSNEPRSATAIAAEDSQLFVLSEATFQSLLNKRVAIQLLLNILRTLSRRLRDTNARLAQ